MVSSSSASSDSSATPAQNRAPASTPCTDPSKIRITVDLVAAARRHLSSLKSVSELPLLHHAPTLRRCVRRYEELWMPLISDRKVSTATMLLPPLDVQWVWHCHCLSPSSYREYCVSRFGVVVERPAIFDEENEGYASALCREIWADRYPSEPFDLQDAIAQGEDHGRGDGDGLSALVSKYNDLCSHFSDLYLSETVYLIAARQRYKGFLHLCKGFKQNNNVSLRLVPTSDVLLMWQVHQSFPVAYARDMKGMGVGDLDRMAVVFVEAVNDEEVEGTKRVWEETFHEPYEKAGAGFRPAYSPARVFFYWEGSDEDVNKKYKALQPRSLSEVLVFLKGRWEEGRAAQDIKSTTLCLKTLRCHLELKLDKPASHLSSSFWLKAWHFYCEFSTRGVVLELRRQGSSCFNSSTVVKKLVFHWNDVLRETSLSLLQELEFPVKAMVSVTPPVQAPYLLRCVPDRVTDDSGAMISDMILRMNGYHPQKGRWLSRTVLDHARRECFVIRIRVGEGFWRRGAESPVVVKREDRIIEVREGSWSYIASSVGTAPQKVIGKAMPLQHDSHRKKATWSLSTGDLLVIQWEGSLEFQIENEKSNKSISLLRGRKLQYEIKNDSLDRGKEEEHFVTLVRSTPENPNGTRATALINWRLFAVEFLPEEDAILVLLLCMAIVRTVSEITREDVGHLLARKRVKEGKAGIRDWGSVMLPSSSSPHLNLWFWNAAEIWKSAEVDDTRQPTYGYSPADGKENMYKQVIMP